MFDFYNLAYYLGYLSLEEIEEAAYWEIITPAEFKQITGKEYKK